MVVREAGRIGVAVTVATCGGGVGVGVGWWREAPRGRKMVERSKEGRERWRTVESLAVGVERRWSEVQRRQEGPTTAQRGKRCVDWPKFQLILQGIEGDVRQPQR